LGLARWYSSAGSDFRGASAFVAQRAAPSDGVLFYAPYVRIPFEFYFARSKAARSLAVSPVYPATRWDGDPARFLEYTPMRARAVGLALRRYRRVWLVLSQYRLYGGDDPGYRNVVVALESSGFRLRTRRTFEGVDVRRYAR
jgi:hypothetical protein